MDFEKAVAFVTDRGNEIEQARINYVLVNERPSELIVGKLFAGQRPDGSWSPFWANDYSSLDATCFRLAQAEQLGFTKEEPAIIRAIRFLAQRQTPDGSWEEDEQIADLAPPWTVPGTVETRLYLTANCGLWLALLDTADTRALKAAGYLQPHLGQDGRLPGFLHSHWLAAALWHKLSWHESAERVFEYLGSNLDDLATSNLSWLITALHAAGVATNHPLMYKAASLLESRQGEDGRWPSEDGSSHDVHSTLETMRALWLCGRVVKRRTAG